MPYSVPAQRPFLPLAAASNDDAPASTTRNHRRSSSNSRFSNENTGPGAFAPINNLPRRKSSRTSPPPVPARPLFQFHPDTDSSDDDPAPPSTHVPLTLDVRPTPSGIPFPQFSPLSSPQPPPPSSPPRTPSASTVRLANGKPLRPSLKSSVSSPHIPHVRARSAPVSPNDEPPPPTPKNVHFKEDAGLASVRLFHTAGKPVSISREDETETETEGYDSPAPAAFPFPPTRAAPAPPLALAPPPLSSPVPARAPSPHRTPPPHPAQIPPAPHVLLTALALTTSADDDNAPALAGTLLVRNIAYEKHVAVRFTLDDWRTTSEVSAAYARPGVLPPAWRALGDNHAYDTFTFRIALHALHRPHTRVLLLAVRLTAAGGEWWDNNAGANYRVAFRPAPPSPPSSTPAPAPAPTRPTLGRSISSPAAPSHTHAHIPAFLPPSSIPFPPAPAPPTLGSITRGTGFSSFSLPHTAPPPPQQQRARLTLRNYAPPKPAVARDSPLPTPPASRTSSVSEMQMPMPLVGGHPATDAREKEKEGAESAGGPDSYAALLARWCFATSGPGPRALQQEEAREPEGLKEGPAAAWRAVGWV